MVSHGELIYTCQLKHVLHKKVPKFDVSDVLTPCARIESQRLRHLGEVSQHTRGEKRLSAVLYETVVTKVVYICCPAF